MAYNKATIKDILPPDTQVGRVKVIVAFTGNAGEPEIDQEYWLDGYQTTAQLQAQVADKATALNNVVSTRTSISVGQAISTAPPATPAQTAAQTYSSHLDNYGHMQRAINLGIKTANDADVVTELSWLKTNYQDSYLTLF